MNTLSQRELTSRPASAACLLLLAAFALVAVTTPTLATGGGPPSYEIDLKDLEKLKRTPGKTAPAAKKSESSLRQAAGEQAKAGGPGEGRSTYTVRPGDNLFKILMRDYGMSNREAELLIPEVIRMNNLASGTRLTVGSTLVIPAGAKGKTSPRGHAQASRPTHPKPLAEREPAAADPAPTATPAAVPAAPEPAAKTEAPVQPAPPEKPLVVSPITGSTTEQIVDGLLNALALPWKRDRVVEGEGPAGPYSIKVDRHLELSGRQIIVTTAPQDPFTYTMLRLLAVSGYTVIRFEGLNGFSAIAPHLLTQLEIPFSSGLYRFTPPAGDGEPRELAGILTSSPSRPARLFLTDTPLDALTGELLNRSRIEPAQPVQVTPAP